MRVDRVDQQRGRVLGCGARVPPVVEPGDVATRACIAFDAVGAGHQDQQLPRIIGADPGDIGDAILTVRAFGGMRVAGEQARAALGDRGQELGSRLPIGITEAIGDAIHLVSSGTASGILIHDPRIASRNTFRDRFGWRS